MNARLSARGRGDLVIDDGHARVVPHPSTGRAQHNLNAKHAQDGECGLGSDGEREARELEVV
jgi:hypothetical protein